MRRKTFPDGVFVYNVVYGSYEFRRGIVIARGYLLAAHVLNRFVVDVEIVYVSDRTFAFGQIEPRVGVLYFEEADLPISHQGNSVFQPRRISPQRVLWVIIHGAIARKREVKVRHSCRYTLAN